MHRDIDTALLRALVAVVETGSVTGAAALLNLTQAAKLLGIHRTTLYSRMQNYADAGEAGNAQARPNAK